METDELKNSPDGAALPGKPISLWLATTPETHFPRIEKDVAVIGGGIAGIATTFLLKQAGLTVAVIEAGRVVESVTGNSTAVGVYGLWVLTRPEAHRILAR